MNENRGVKQCCLLLIVLLGVPQAALAYTDPGSGALIWQMLMAGGIGLLFYARKLTSWFRRKDKGEKR